MKHGYIKYFKWVLGAWFLLSTHIGLAQNFGNEWINLNQKYYKFSIPSTGIYHITLQQLQQAGVPVNSNNPQNIQLFYNGQEIPCYIKGESTGLLEYIEFYAQKNTGWFDLDMYDNPINQANPYYSMITDTAAVFITWNTSFTNRRMKLESDQNFTGYTPAPYCKHESQVHYTSIYFASYPDCLYTEGEGWVDAEFISLGNTLTKSIPTPEYVSNVSNVNISWALLSKSFNRHHLKISGPGFSTDTIFSEYKTIKMSYSITGVALSDQTNLAFSSIDDGNVATDFSSVSYISVTYPRTFAGITGNSFTFSIPASPTKKTYLEFPGIASGNYSLFDVSRGSKIAVSIENSILKTLIPASDSEVQLVLVKDEGRLLPTQIAPSVMINHASKNREHLIMSHPLLWPQAEEYANYRGAYLINAEYLYDQFGYGIRKHPMAIRNFLRYIASNWTTQPTDLFIIGKGVNMGGRESNNLVETRNNPTAFNASLVPSMGYTASDELLGMKVKGTGLESFIPIGRLAARTGDQVTTYLEKVKEFEQSEPAEWMKRMIHFGGGINEGEQNLFKNYLNNYALIASDSLFGGFVSTFLKKSSDPITISRNDSITGLINNGVSLMTFFGHGSTNGFDQNVDEPDSYQNKGKYPLMLANSCYSGNIHLYYQNSTSEDWVLIPDKGSIGFLAMVGEGFPTYLDMFSTQFYKNLSYVSYGKPIGIVIRNAKIAMQENTYNDHYFKETIHSFTLHGDPLVVLNSFPLPDLYLAPEQVFFTPQNITTEIDSFLINIVPVNISKTSSQSFIIDVQRTFQDGSVANYQAVQNGLFYKDTLKIKVPVDFVKGQGLNEFFIRLDAQNQLTELSEDNNTTLVSTFISSSDLIPVIPYEYSIYPLTNPVLKASTGDALSDEQTSIFELDTTPQFNSTMLISKEITHSGGVVEWNPGIQFTPQTPYFWRAAKKSNAETLKWSNSSFAVEADQSGWQQKNMGQMLENQFKFIETNTATNQYVFSDAPKSVRCHNIGSPNNSNYTDIGYTVEGIGDYSSCGAASALLVVVIDSATLIPWKSDRAVYGQGNYPKCFSRNFPDNYYVFHLGATQTSVEQGMDNVVNLIETQVPDGFYILIYSFIAGNYQLWRERHYAAFLEWGASNNIRFLQNNQPYIFFSQKGNPVLGQEVSGTTTETIDLKAEIKSSFTYGTISSVPIGPSTQWNTFSWEHSALEVNPSEIAFVRIFGINTSNTSILLMDSITQNEIDLSFVDVGVYPYLQLQFYTRDDINKTPSQIRSWKIIYQPVTDLAINPQKGWSFYADSIQEGDKCKVLVAFENIGLVDLDSVRVNYWMYDAGNNQQAIASHKVRPLRAGEVVVDSLEFGTLNRIGNNQLWMEINPETNTRSGFDQWEQYHFNNLATKTFYVKKDERNPLLDVTFDGLHIMDGDLVSAQPEIAIQLNDDNKYIALNDTSLFSIYIKSQNTGIENKLALTGNPNIQFIPAQLPDNKARIIYQGSFSEDGIYELRVQAKDPSGNESGLYDYLISFEVINESTITNVFNYPNPFSTSTQFVFELTGSELPDELRIEILTVTGKIVKVIYLDELGPITIGKNISQYTWNGTDMYGDALANGIYFYRFFARRQGKDLKMRDTGTSQYFKNGFGKMYLMR
jgi:hypothetical protein